LTLFDSPFVLNIFVPDHQSIIEEYYYY